jgi:hypothetical protein
MTTVDMGRSQRNVNEHEAMDTERAVAKIEAFVALLEVQNQIERSPHLEQYGYLDNPTWRSAQANVDASIGLCERIANIVDERLGDRIREGRRRGTTDTMISACRELTARLRGREEEEAILGP